MLRAKWWKLLSFVLLLYTCTYGFLVEVPKLDDRMQESIRNFFFHVPMWFGMMIWYHALHIGGAVHVSQVQIIQPFLTIIFSWGIWGRSHPPPQGAVGHFGQNGGFWGKPPSHPLTPMGWDLC